MASKKVNVEVFDGERLVVRLAARPVRLMPDGYAGVVYNGMVYPFYERNFVQLTDTPIAKDDCVRFVGVYAEIPYARRTELATPFGDGHLGIEDWYLETNRFGHYLVFDSSEEVAQRLVDAVEFAGLGVRRCDESSRSADNGQFYDWFIRLAFDGSREECLEKLRELLEDEAAPLDVDLLEEVSCDNATDYVGDVDLDEVVQLVLSESAPPIDAAETVEFLKLFDLKGNHVYKGYFSCRYREAVARLGPKFGESAGGRLQVIGSIIRDDKELLARLIGVHGRFLDDDAGAARRALAAEFDKIDLDATWYSPDDALRMAHASSVFVRRSALLMFGYEECREQLQHMVTTLAPPPPEQRPQYPEHVAAAIANLDRMIGFVETLLSGSNDEFAERFVNGWSELEALAEGNFDYIDGIGRRTENLTHQVDDLGFVVLPPGELLQSFIAELRSAGHYKGREVDLKRTDVLTRLQRYFSDSQCRLHRGAFSSSGEDNLYVVLSIARPGVRAADAVAISPCKGEHATFVVRHDCGERRPWNQVLSRTKREAKQLGARRLLFTSKSGRGIDEYDAMMEKLVRLLDCDADEFDCPSGFVDYGDDPWIGARRNGERSSTANRTPRNEAAPAPGVVEKIFNWITGEG